MLIGELLNKMIGMNQQEKIQFLMQIHEWTGRQLGLIQQLNQSQFIEVVTDKEDDKA